MKLLDLVLVAATVCGLAAAVPGAPGSPPSTTKPRRRCSRRPHSLATSRTYPHTTSKTVTISTTCTTHLTTNTASTSTTTPASTTTAAPPVDTTTIAPPVDTTTTAPPVDTTTTAPPVDTTTTAPPADTTTTAPPVDTSTTGPPVDTTTTAPPVDTSTTAPPVDTTTTAAPTSTTTAPPLNTCDLGTGFGYRPPVNGVVLSPQLDTTGGQGCNRWGWYTTPTLAQLQAAGGISGQLLVGAGNNNLNAATNVGTFTATATPQGGVTVTHVLAAPYVLTQVHVDLRCLPIATCAPGQYTYGASGIPALSVWANSSPLPFPATCPAGRVVYLIVHAAVSELKTGRC